MIRYFLLSLLLILFVGCTNSRWIILEEPATDYSDRRELETRPLLLLEEEPSRGNPIMIITSAEVNEVAYTTRLVSERHVQRFRPRYVVLALGLGTAATAIYLANYSDAISYDMDTRDRRILSGAGVAAALSSFMSMRPYGEPRPTGERKLLNEVGETTGFDTTYVVANTPINGRILYNNVVLEESDNFFIQDGFAEINFRDAFSDVRISDDDPGDFTLEFDYEFRQYSFSFPVAAVFHPFIVIERDNAAIRTQASNTQGQTLANLELDSFLPLRQIRDGRWYETRYNLAEAYINREDARIEWRIGTTGQQATIQAEDIPFGQIEIEMDIPEVPVQSNRVGLIISIGNYSGNLLDIPNAERSARLVRDYMIKSLGIPQDHIIQLADLRYEQWRQFSDRIDSLRLGSLQLDIENPELFVYYVGHGVADDANRLYLVPADYAQTQRRILISDFMTQLGRFQAQKRAFFFETDFSEASLYGQRAERNIGRGAALRETAQTFIQNHPNSVVFFAVNNGQQAGIFASPDGRINNVYGFFTFYLLQAIKNGNVEAGDIFRHVQRNATFTSRRYYDRPQDPQFFGPSTLHIGVQISE